MLYSRGRFTEEGISDMVRVLQMDHNAHGVDGCTINVHVDDE